MIEEEVLLLNIGVVTKHQCVKTHSVAGNKF